jgi:hypothetical protein
MLFKICSFTCSFICRHSQECLETPQKLNGLWRGRIYAPLLQQPFTADAISALPKGIKLLQRSIESMQSLTAAVQRCMPASHYDCYPPRQVDLSEVAAQQTFLQDLQQHNPAQLAAELDRASSRAAVVAAGMARPTRPTTVCCQQAWHAKRQQQGAGCGWRTVARSNQVADISAGGGS